MPPPAATPPVRTAGQLATQIAGSCGAPAALLPVFPELFRGIDALGSRPAQLAGLLARHGITARSTLLDLGCGKGAVAVTAARRLRCRVTGVDAFAPFIAHAQDLAKKHGVTRLCTFTVGAVRTRTSGRGFDAAIMLNVLEAGHAARVLRTHIRAGGLYILDDAYVDPRAGGAGVGIDGPDRDELRRRIASTGDTIIAELVAPPLLIRKNAGSLLRRLSANAARISRSHPRLRKPLADFLHGHRTAAEYLGGLLRPVTWAVRKAT